MIDLLLKNCRIVLEGRAFEGCIGADSGRIACIGLEPSMPRAERALDLGGKLVIPGPIDVHTHVFSPGWIRETFKTGTAAAAVGGVTTIADMSSVGEWQTATVKTFKEKLESGRGDSLVDFCLYCGEICREEDLEEIPEILEMGAVGLGEIMMCEPDPIPDHGVLLEAMKVAKRGGAILSIHAEDRDLIKRSMKAFKAEGGKDYSAFSESRPPMAEKKAILDAAMLASEAGCDLHICHVSTREGVEALRLAKRIHQGTTSEVTPHHLLLTAQDYERLGPLIVATPPVRDKEDAVALWSALSLGLIEAVASDHCAFKTAEKTSATSTWEVPAGMPGLETTVTLMWSEGVQKRRISLGRFVEALSMEPARMLGVYPRKGCLAPGSDADLVVIDQGWEGTIGKGDMRCVADYTPFEGTEVKGRPVITIIRGEIVAEGGSILAKPGYGEYIPRQMKG